MKIAHLILAHKNPAQLARLVKALQHPDFDFYIHIDKKTAESPFCEALAGNNIFFIKKRTKIYWAGYGTIQATLNGFEEILDTGKAYGYINVLSAQDFPIKSAGYIHQYFSNRRGTEFITCESIENEWKEAASRVKKFHLINWKIPGKYRIEKWINKILPERTFPLDYKLVGRANWFTLTPDAVQYVLSFLQKNPKVVRFFKYCWGADEFIFATVLYNSSFRDQITPNTTYVDWTGRTDGHPRILLTSDLERLKIADKLFARKFDIETDVRIIELLEGWITQDAGSVQN